MIKRIIQLVVDKASAKRAEEELRKGGKEAERSWTRNWANIRAAGLAAIAAVTAAAAGLVRLTQRGGEVLNLERAFTRITGFQTGAIERLQEATSGLVSKTELMRQANMALTLGSADTVEQFEKLTTTAQQLGRALGLDAAFAINSLNIGIARQSRLVLDNLGIIVSAADANRKYADALGITVDQLTDAQKKEAFRSEALEQARMKTQELGAVTLNAADSFKQLQIEITNATDDAAKWAATSQTASKFWDSVTATIRSIRAGTGLTGAAAELAIIEAQREQARLEGAGRFLPGRAAPPVDPVAAQAQRDAQVETAAAFNKSQQAVRDFNLELEILNSRIVEIDEPVIEPWLGRMLDVGDALHLTGASVTTMAGQWLPELDISLQNASVQTLIYKRAMEEAGRENENFGESLGPVLQRLGAFGGIFGALSRIPGLGLLSSILNPLGIATGVLGGFAGLFQHGGMIPAGSWGIVGERGPELAFGGAGGTAVSPNPIQVNVAPGRVPSDWWRDQDWMRGIENANRELASRGFRFS